MELLQFAFNMLHNEFTQNKSINVRCGNKVAYAAFGVNTHMLFQIIKTAARINFCPKRRHYRHISYVSVSELQSATAYFLNDCL